MFGEIIELKLHQCNHVESTGTEFALFELPYSDHVEVHKNSGITILVHTGYDASTSLSDSLLTKSSIDLMNLIYLNEMNSSSSVEYADSTGFEGSRREVLSSAVEQYKVISVRIALPDHTRLEFSENLKTDVWRFDDVTLIVFPSLLDAVNGEQYISAYLSSPNMLVSIRDVLHQMKLTYQLAYYGETAFPPPKVPSSVETSYEFLGEDESQTESLYDHIVEPVLHVVGGVDDNDLPDTSVEILGENGFELSRIKLGQLVMDKCEVVYFAGSLYGFAGNYGQLMRLQFQPYQYTTFTKHPVSKWRMSLCQLTPPNDHLAFICGGVMFEDEQACSHTLTLDECVWKQVRPMELKRSNHTVTALNESSVAAVGGSLEPTCFTEIFDAEKNTWTKGPQLNDQRVMHSTATLNGTLFTMGGYGNNGKYLDSMEYYDRRSPGGWTISKTPLPTPQALFGSTTCDDSIWLAGGKTIGRHKLNAVNVFESRCWKWRQSGLTLTKKRYQSAVVLVKSLL